MGAALALLQRELRLASRIGGGGLVGVIFFLTLVVTVPFGVGPDMALLSRIGPAVLWIGALLGTLLALDRLFQADEEDGSLDLLMTSPLPLALVVLVKCFAHWLATVLPLVIAAPLLGLMLGLPGDALLPLTATLLVGTPALTSLGAIGAALTVSLRRGGLLLAVLVLPLTMPIMIFGVSAAGAAIVGPTPFAVPFSILAGLALLAVVLSPLAAAAALRASRG